MKKHIDKENESAHTADAIATLRSRFEGKQALYLEQGALVVRVTDIRGPGLRETVSAQVEEIPSSGMRVGRFGTLDRPAPLRWTIRAGYLTEFSEEDWCAGYGGWSLYFDPKLVGGAMDLASRLSGNVDALERYRRILDVLNQHQRSLQLKRGRVFAA